MKAYMLIDFIVMNMSHKVLKSFRVDIYPSKELTSKIYNWLNMVEHNHLKLYLLTYALISLMIWSSKME